MPLTDPITPGVVDWTGENPGILLKDTDGNFSAMALFFRVAWSPVGQGQVLLLYGTPGAAEGTVGAPNVMLADNMPLAAFLKENFIGKLPAFRSVPAFDALPVKLAQTVRSTGDPMGHRYTETVSGEGLTVELVWEDLGPPRALELMPNQVGTGQHTMFTLLVPANDAKIIVNGHLLPGAVGERIQAGFKTTTAFLYFSETWVLPPEVA
ncbi:hypothetical protein [Defluviimonas sp. WL0075]|uniref:Uncharacterized protein n=1 Tax=Albidovulum sediminicola TaxID=2984331 RepID=A0ABT2Z5K2_9RHOB|nr:hypothetical protein [Defluviimonas sp. WL0075]MCV2866373.1 hypothetical protein [Defluviimonas sp. WL0075]